jgi:hypothetical protein
MTVLASREVFKATLPFPLREILCFYSQNLEILWILS